MKISNKEKIMLSILGIVLIALVYYQFIFSAQMSAIEEKTKTNDAIVEKYNSAMNTINSIESRKSDVKILNAKISDEALPFYPTISEEHIILELDKLLNDSGLKGGIKFDPIVSDAVESTNKKDETLKESSLQGIVDEYNTKTEDNKEKSDSKTNNSAKNEANSNNKANSNINNSKSDDKSSTSNNSKDKKTTNTVHYVKVQVNFQGSYDGLSKLMSTISANEKKIVVNSLQVSQDTIDKVKGTLNLEIYSVPKINDELENYLRWSLTNTYGKSVPFSKGAASGIVQGRKDSSDFAATVKSNASDLPTIMMGKVNDLLRTTYVYADSNSTEEVEMILTQQGDKYYYKYKTSKGTYPAKYDGIGVEFTPLSQNIVLNILSENRVGSNDKSELKLKLINKTDRLMNVNISGDDLGNPRVKVEGDGSNISVNQK